MSQLSIFISCAAIIISIGSLLLDRYATNWLRNLEEKERQILARTEVES